MFGEDGGEAGDEGVDELFVQEIESEEEDTWNCGGGRGDGGCNVSFRVPLVHVLGSTETRKSEKSSSYLKLQNLKSQISIYQYQLHNLFKIIPCILASSYNYHDSLKLV